MIRTIILGGFLGSGKTTALLRLASAYRTEGRRVLIVANDLGEGLVDAHWYRAHGFDVSEFAGGCFACNMTAFRRRARALLDAHSPDVLLIEPSGSCTNIVADAIGPLAADAALQLDVAPYGVLVDPGRLRAAMAGRLGSKVAFLFGMQQSEARYAALSKADSLDGGEAQGLLRTLSEMLPRAEVFALSPATGHGMERWRALLDGAAPEGMPPAASGVGECGIGMVSASWLIRPGATDARALVVAVASLLQQECARAGFLVGHVKVMVRWDGGAVVASVVEASLPPNVTGDDGAASGMELLVNARVAAPTDWVQAAVEQAVLGAAREAQLQARAVHTSSADSEVPGHCAR